MALTQISTAGVKDDAVTAGKIPANAVGSSELADNAVDTAAIAANAVTASRIADSSVQEAKINNGAVTVHKIGPGSVNSSKIADATIGLDKLVHGTSSNDGKFLRANNGADPTFETVNTDLVADTSPQLGGNLDTNGNNINFAANDGAVFASDLTISHTGDHGNIVNTDGNLNIKSQGTISLFPANDNDGITIVNGGAVSLYHNNANRLQTTAAGVNFSGNLSSDSGGNFTINAGGASGTAAHFIARCGSENAIVAAPNGAVELYNNNLKQVETFHGNAGQSGTDITAGGLKTTRTNSHNSNIGYYCYKDSNLVARLSNHGSGPEGILQLYNQGVAKITMNGTNGTIKLHGNSSYIQFGDTNSTHHQLDDYEEGTWTPTFVSTGASFQYNHQYGYYQKVGNTVHVSFYITLGNGSPLSGTTSNTLHVAVPFQATSATRYEAACCFSMIYKFNLNGGGNDILLTGRLYSGNSKIDLLAQFDDAAGYAYTAVKADQGGCGLAGSITYRVNQ